MGVSLTQWRSSIGSFQSTKVKTKNESSQSTSSVKKQLGSILVLLILASILASLPLINSTPENVKTHCYSRCQFPAQSSAIDQDSLHRLQDTPCRLSSRDRNFYAKMVNGNRGARGSGLKLLHWNKGPAFLQNKHTEIETIIAGHHPHVLGLSEANFKKSHDHSLVQLENYKLHTSPTADNPDLQTSRVVVYTHNSLVVKRRPDLEDNRVSAIWLEVGLPNKRKILHCHGYREWRYLDQPDSSSSTVAAQFQRWSIFLTMWEKLL